MKLTKTVFPRNSFEFYKQQALKICGNNYFSLQQFSEQLFCRTDL